MERYTKQTVLPFCRHHAAVNVPQRPLAVHLCGVDDPSVTACKRDTKRSSGYHCPEQHVDQMQILKIHIINMMYYLFLFVVVFM